MTNLDSPQWKRAQQTSLWKRTLGSDDEDVKSLRDSFLDARKNAAVLLEKISPAFPKLTIHDITHVDSLWSVADAIIGENYPINPLEGYVLGIAFLIHDAALSYDAVGGKDKLRNTIEWKDAHAEKPENMDEDEFKKECDFIAIRAIHAKEAKEIMSRTFSSEDLPSFHIVKKASYRHSLGEIIGKIAASHHWSIDEIKSKLEIQITPSSEIPGYWDINAQKLACILRCADAGHIDDGRAPYYIFRSLNLNGVSLEHWKSQSRLGVVRPYIRDTSKLLITSTSSFKKEDFAAWNVAYEAVKLFDEELKKSNNLLKSIDDELAFPRSGVLGANSKEELAEHIKTEGWQPCSFGVHTSNIKYLIESLGGSKLYGEDNMLLVALRELIQNARDAIHARQTLEKSFDNGKITIRLIEDGDDRYIEVEDNGIGMSMDCIKYHLLDFGSSYWKSSLSKYENPGLRSKAFTSVGQFGIGFYSVFMVAKSVEVRTKRYKGAVDDAKRVEFPAGLTLSPIISNDTMSSSVSTIVRFELKDDIELSFNIGSVFYGRDVKVTLIKILPLIVAGLDCDVYYHDECIHKDISSSGFDKKEWLESLCLDSSTNSVIDFDKITDSLEKITDENGKIRGLVFIFDNDYEYEDIDESLMPSIVTVGGLLAYRDNSISSIRSMRFSDLDSTLYNGKYGFIGYIDCKGNSISRDKVYIDEPLKKPLNDWFTQKYIDNYIQIKNSTELSQCYNQVSNFINLDANVLDKIIKHNIEDIFNNLSEFSRKSEVMSTLKIIHRRLFVGLKASAGIYRDGVMGFYSDASFMEDDVDERVYELEQMPECEYDEIIKKYMYIMVINPFRFGCDLVAGIWVNMKLFSQKRTMINWGRMNIKDFFMKFGQFEDNSKSELLCDYLKQYLEDGNKDIFSSCITTGYW